MPPVSCLTTSTAFSSLMLMTRSAPSSLPIASRLLRVPVRITGLAPSALATATASSPIGPGPDHDHAFAGDQPAQFGQAIHRRAGGDDQRRFGIAHGVGHPRQRVDVIDGIFGKAAIGGKAVGAMAFSGFAVVEARGVHALPAALALAAAGMDLDADALADPEFVDIRSERRDRAHIFVARREILVEGQAAQDARWRAGVDDLKIGRADRDRIDTDQNFGPRRHRRRLVAQEKLVRDRPAPRPSSGRGQGSRMTSSRQMAGTWVDPLFSGT